MIHGTKLFEFLIALELIAPHRTQADAPANHFVFYHQLHTSEEKQLTDDFVVHDGLPKEKPPKGQRLMNTHKLGKLGITNPDLRRYRVTNTQVLT
jgi:hypothetical protein